LLICGGVTMTDINKVLVSVDEFLISAVPTHA
jgi:hypothetical protein